MKGIISVTYKKNFPVSQFIFETIGVEVMVNEDEDPVEKRKEAKEWVESQRTPIYEEMRGTQVRNIEEDTPVNKYSGFIEAINTSTSLKSVEIFRKLVERENIPELTTAFEEKIKTFQ